MTDATLVPAERDAPAAPAELTLRLFGTFAATLGGQPLPRLRSRKEQHLLCLLALRSPRPTERVWLAGTLWPDSTEEAALFYLRRSLHLVRAALGTGHGTRLHSPTPATLALNTDEADVDVCAFDDALRQKTPAALENALALCSRPLLEDCTEDWAITERTARQESLLAACEICAAQCAEAGDRAGAARLLRHSLSLDPLRETTVRALMQSLAATGDTAGAMDAFRRFRRRLRRELDAAPAPETRALLGQILDALSPVPSASVRLPRPLTPLVGRRREVADIVSALDTARLVTLTGMGGVGKTRLAIATAEDLSEETEVCFVALAALTDATQIMPAVARALEIAGPCDTADALTIHLRQRSLLLVLDNCEHLLDGCAALATVLLEECVRLRVLATSRQPLGLPGEVVRPVPLLSVPPVENTSLPETDYEAVQLFVARARAARPSFSLDARTRPAVVRICRRLDGLPLAIELAAARVRSLPCEQIANKLDDRFGLLSGGNRGALPRHQTLRAAVDWSYDLLTEAERLLLGRVSVFAGGWTAEAAEAVCGDDLPLQDALTGLVDKSLVQMQDSQMQETAAGEARYFLLETLREYGQEKLAQSGEADTLAACHREWFLTLAEDAAPLLTGPAQGAWLVRLETEHDNLRAALEWCAFSGDTESGLRLSGALWRFWERRGHLSEGRRQLTRALAQSADSLNLSARAIALSGMGILAWRQGDYVSAEAGLQECLALRREMDDPQGVANALSNLGILAMSQTDYERARYLTEESLALRRQTVDREGIANSLNNLALLDMEAHCYAAARAHLEESLWLRRQMEDGRGIAMSLFNLGLAVMGMEDYGAAHAAYRECLPLFAEIGDRASIISVLEGMGAIAGTQGQPERAAHLWGAADTLREELSVPQDASDRQKQEQEMADARAQTGADAFAAAWAAGRAMITEQAVAYALTEISSPAPSPVST